MAARLAHRPEALPRAAGLRTRLEKLSELGVVSLHDRVVAGTAVDVDHVAIAPSGIWVVSECHVSGQVAKRDIGTFGRDWRLYVGRSDCTRLLAGMARQVRAVRSALGEDAGQLPVLPVLCFDAAEWSWLATPLQMSGVVVAPPKAVAQLVSQPGPWSAMDIGAVAESIDARLAPAA